MVSKQFARKELTPLREKLETWVEQIPKHAEQFHSTSNQCIQQIEQLSGTWWQPWISQDTLDEIKEEASRLNEIAPRLEALLQQRDTTQTDIDRFIEKLDNIENAQIKSWGRQYSESWSSELTRLGTNCNRDSDIKIETRSLEKISSALSLYIDGVIQFKTTQYFLNEFGNTDTDQDKLTLDEEFSKFQQAILDDALSKTQIDRLKQCMLPLQRKLDSIKTRHENNARMLSSVSNQIRDLEGWSSVLRRQSQLPPEFQSQIAQLRIQQRDLMAESKNLSVTRIQTIHEEAKALLQNLKNCATEFRKQELDKLKFNFTDVFRFSPVGENDFESRLKELSAQSVERYQNYQHWLAELQKIKTDFTGISQHKLGELQDRLENEIIPLAKDLKELQDKRLFSKTRNQIQQLSSQIDKLKDADGSVDAVLHSLTQLDNIKQQTSKLKDEIEQVLKNISNQQKQFELEFNKLQELANKHKFQIADIKLDVDIEQLLQITEQDNSLEIAQSRVGTIKSRLSELEKELGEHIDEQLENKKNELKQVQDLNSQQEINDFIGQSANMQTLDDESDAIEKANNLLEKAQENRKNEIGQLNSLCVQYQAQFKKFELDNLTPAQKDDLELVLYDLEKGISTSSTLEETEQLDWLQDIVKRSQELQSDLTDDTEFIERLRKLKQDISKCQREGLSQLMLVKLNKKTHKGQERLVLDLFSQVEALAFGINEKYMTPESLKQLETAERLFESVYIQTRRLAAYYFAKSIENFEKSHLKTRISTKEIKQLHKDIEACKVAHFNLPSKNLRQKLSRYTK